MAIERYIGKLPATWTILGPCLHPRDGTPGTAVELPSGAFVFVIRGGRCVRSLRPDWRRFQTNADPDATRAAELMTATLRAARQGGAR